MTEPDLAESMVYIVDDDNSVRASLQDLLASVNLPSMAFASAREFRDATLPDIPACLILDVRMPGMSGLDFQQEMARLNLPLPVIFITAHGDIPMSVKAMKAGALEFLTKPFREQDLLDAISQGLNQDRERRKADAVMDDLKRRYDSLTDGEREVMELVVSGLLNKQVAGRLGLSEVTVKVRRGALMRKMEADSLAALVKMSERLKGMSH
ncbi:MULTISPECIES: response regulator transcription factor [unclassified Pseudomonas]|uniref:response regulator transcription factor n=1 Tax=unclassified Pseudomonas TaxID=196821 RepID=UPI00119C0799|nr:MULTISPECIES: response regulator [unclassified Pseudomonas]TWC17567.1 LuxR family two component transcriptional regulator [Pseudomonas sp. SJZ074]TWC19695.1 LuxR family two component transcriptional regulator [Pseudomonas sp. SJZ075]TWC35405.1 LuxR family two component transcriptional regulator [Pseudomonas sp. SJZ078]TWC35523.1 LuxR family two component transcriptional regulator [Pseudomonas sp. SJZ085]TWC56351.1 LuxR family two component transcriptional regulator [Pseudomonas sp. SJZ124]